MTLQVNLKGYTSSDSDGTSLQIASVAITSGNALVVVMDANGQGGGESVSFGGTGLTAIGSVSDPNDTSMSAHWKAGLSGTQTVTASWTVSQNARWMAVFELYDSEGGDWKLDTSGFATGNDADPTVTTDASVTQADCIAISALSNGGSITSAGGDTDQTYGLTSLTEVDCCAGYEVHTAASGTLTAAYTAARAKGSRGIAVFYPEGSPQAPAQAASATGSAPAATVTPGAVNATAGLTEATGAAPAATVQAGAVQVDAALASATGTAPAATVDAPSYASAAACSATANAPAATVTPGAVQIAAALCFATAAAVAATVTPGAVSADAGLTEATASAVSPEISGPPHLWIPDHRSGYIHLPDAIVHNGTHYPDFKFCGADFFDGNTTWKHRDYGSDITIAGSGSDPDRWIGPGVGNGGASARFNDGKYGTYASAVDLPSDWILSILLCGGSEAATRNILDTRKTDGSNGFTLYQTSTHAMYLLIKGAVNQISSGAIITCEESWAFVEVWWNTDWDNSAGYTIFRNGTIGTQGNPTTVGAMDSDTLMHIASRYDGNQTWDGAIAYLALYRGTNFLSETQNDWINIHKERFSYIRGLLPGHFTGNYWPIGSGRGSEAGLSKLVNGVCRCTQVKHYWERYGQTFDTSGNPFAGLIAEGAATELAAGYTEDFSSGGGYDAAGLTVGSGSVTHPDARTHSNTKLSEDASTGTHYVRRAFSYTTGGRHVVSCVFKAINRNYARLQVADSSNHYLAYNIATGTYITSSNVDSYGCFALGDGWYRIWMSFTHSNGGSSYTYIYLANSGGNTSWTGNDEDSLYAFGLNAKTAEFPGEYSRETAQMDDVVFVGDDGNLGGTGDNAAGSLFCRVWMPAQNSFSDDRTLIRLYDSNNPSTDYIGIKQTSTAASPVLQATSAKTSGSAGSSSVSGNHADGDVHEVILHWDTDSFQIIVDGSAGTEDTDVDPPINLNRIAIGYDTTDGDTGLPLWGYIGNINITARKKALFAHAAASTATGAAPAATVTISLSASAAACSATASAPAATVTPGSVNVAAGLTEATATAPAATVEPGAVQVGAGLTEATATAPASTVQAGEVQVSAGLTEATGTAPAATVNAGEVQVDAGLASATGTAPAATVTVGAVQVDAGLASAIGTAPAATVQAGAVQVDAALTSATGTAPAATVQAGEVQVDAALSSATGTAPTATVQAGAVQVVAALASAAGTAPNATVLGAVEADAQLASATGAAPAATVQAGAVQVDAALASATGTAPDATVDTSSQVAAQLASATGAAPAATVQTGEVQVSAGLTEATADAPAATVQAGEVQVTAGLASATGAAPAATVQVGEVQVTAGLASATGTAPAATVDAQTYVDAALASATGAAPAATVSPGAVQVSAGLTYATATAPNANASAGASFADAQLADATGAAPAATVQVGGVNVAAGLTEATATAPAATVDPGAVQIAAALASATGTAPDAGVDAVCYVDAALASATATAPNATAQAAAVEADAQLASATADAPAATVTAGEVQVDAALASATGTAPAATATAGESQAQAQLSSATGAAPAATVQVGEVQVAAGLTEATADAPAASVQAGEVQVAAGQTSATGAAPAAAVLPGEAQVTAGLASATAEAPNAAVSATGNAPAAAADATATAPAATVLPGAVQVSAGQTSATATAPDADGYTNTLVDAQLASATGAAPNASVEVGTAQAQAQLASATATAPSPTVDTGPVQTQAALTSATATAPDAGVQPGVVSTAASLSSATATAPDATAVRSQDAWIQAEAAYGTAQAPDAAVQVGEVQIAAELARATAAARAAAVATGVNVQAELARATATAPNASVLPFAGTTVSLGLSVTDTVALGLSVTDTISLDLTVGVAMSTTVEITRGDTPNFVFTISDQNGAVMDLTPYTVRFSARNVRSCVVIFNKTASKTDPTAGEAQSRLLQTESTPKGTYLAEVELFDAANDYVFTATQFQIVISDDVIKANPT